MNSFAQFSGFALIALMPDPPACPPPPLPPPDITFVGGGHTSPGRASAKLTLIAVLYEIRIDGHWRKANELVRMA
jgi:hypothetical protein